MAAAPAALLPHSTRGHPDKNHSFARNQQFSRISQHGVRKAAKIAVPRTRPTRATDSSLLGHRTERMISLHADTFIGHRAQVWGWCRLRPAEHVPEMWRWGARNLLWSVRYETERTVDWGMPFALGSSADRRVGHRHAPWWYVAWGPRPSRHLPWKMGNEGITFEHGGNIYLCIC